MSGAALSCHSRCGFVAAWEGRYICSVVNGAALLRQDECVQWCHVMSRRCRVESVIHDVMCHNVTALHMYAFHPWCLLIMIIIAYLPSSTMHPFIRSHFGSNYLQLESLAPSFDGITASLARCLCLLATMLATLFAQVDDVVDDTVAVDPTVDDSAAVEPGFKRARQMSSINSRVGVQHNRFAEAVVIDYVPGEMWTPPNAETAAVMKTVSGRYWKIGMVDGSPVYRQECSVDRWESFVAPPRKKTQKLKKTNVGVKIDWLSI